VSVPKGACFKRLRESYARRASHALIRGLREGELGCRVQVHMVSTLFMYTLRSVAYCIGGRTCCIGTTQHALGCIVPAVMCWVGGRLMSGSHHNLLEMLLAGGGHS
jgi:hypothetical protein